MADATIYHSPLAGSWYPRDAGELKNLLADVLTRSAERTGQFTRQGGIAFLVPHAAPVYSGTVAASVYRHIAASGADRIVILGFSHRRPINGIAIPEAGEIDTPLGAVAVDHQGAATLARTRPFHLAEPEAASDHSVEIQLPFLQTVAPRASILPLYVGRLTLDQRKTAAHALRELMNSRTVLVASSDLTHYGRDFGYRPFDADENAAQKLRSLDTRMLDAAGSLDACFFQAELDATGSTLCGREPILLLLETLAPFGGPEIFQDTLDYDTSGAMTDDYTHSVSYGATGYFPESAFHLNARDRAAILAAARRALDRYRFPDASQSAREGPQPELRQPGRAFVTLFSGKGDLRGCVGRFLHPLPLSELIPELTVAAATDDPRFNPVKPDEQLSIEVHILTPPKRIRDASQLRVGEHGGYLKAGGKSGLLLPSVAARHGLGHGAFLRALAQKAELPDNIYRSAGAQLSVFRDQCFEEA